MQKIDGKQISIIIPDDLLKEVDRIAKRTGKKRADAIRTLLYFGCDIYSDFENVGIVSLAEVIHKAIKKIKKDI